MRPRYIGSVSQSKLVAALESRFQAAIEQDNDAVSKKIGINRATWFRWKNGSSRISVKKAVQTCSAAGIDPRDILAISDIDRVEVTRPYQKLELILSYYTSFRNSELTVGYHSIVAEAAVLVQEVLMRNDMSSDLIISRTADKITSELVVKLPTGARLCTLQFSDRPNGIYAELKNNTQETEAEFQLGNRSFQEIIRLCLMFDKQFKSSNKEHVGNIQRASINLIQRTTT